MHRFILIVTGLVYECRGGKALLPSVLSPAEIAALLVAVWTRSFSRQGGGSGKMLPEKKRWATVRVRDLLLLSFAYRYGVSEPGRLLVQDLDLATATVLIRRGGELPRRYPLFPDMIPYCVMWFQQRKLPQFCGAERIPVAFPTPEEDFLFPHRLTIWTDTGQRLQGVTPGNLEFVMRNALQNTTLRLPVDRVTPDGFRRAIGAHLIAEGWTPDEVAYHLGVASEYAPTLEEYRDRLAQLAASPWIAPLP